MWNYFDSSQKEAEFKKGFLCLVIYLIINDLWSNLFSEYHLELTFHGV